MNATLPLIGTEIFEPEHGEKFTPECDEVRLKEALRRLKLKMKKNFMPYLDYYNVVEIYSMDGRQLYSNGRFYEVSSIPAAEIPKKPFDELFIRPIDIQQALFASIAQAMTNTEGEVLEAQIPTHTLRESCGEGRVIKVDFQYFTTLFDENDQVAALLVTQDAEVVPSPMLRIMN